MAGGRPRSVPCGERPVLAAPCHVPVGLAAPGEQPRLSRPSREGWSGLRRPLGLAPPGPWVAPLACPPLACSCCEPESPAGDLNRLKSTVKGVSKRGFNAML